ncbi:glycoside hydrolase superfamily [Lasiosphaeria miniovina]|uniref:Endoglucanase EG-II n=1 Tax=Lasiosphaeria miniovina TaxID=1954250 RepID=A0AA40ADW3_9PEZI|nr:glycoside hydrolase superfamily [Lasiosphaeria miniovina]KAK0714056.1 glycoside hydrolase superfamily [Lasiosphaeria miniovina]
MLSKSLVYSALVSLAAARVQYLGVGIAGGDFGCQIDGSCPTGSTQLPLSSLGGGDGEGQMKHFVQDNQMNMFRLPISWQFLVNNKLGATLDSTNLAKYDKLVQACLATGAHCMVEIHNFARWNKVVIGQGDGSVTDDHFVSLWAQLATKYAAADRVVFELMNEPHDLDVTIWAATCGKAIAAIRNAGATTHTILLPGTNFNSAAKLVSSGSADALAALTNPDGTADGLLLDVHKYLDTDNSGTHAECVTNNTDAFAEVAAFLRRTGRKAIVSETGAAPGDAACLAMFCEQNAFINANADVFVGLVTWGAGSFSPSYLLSATPSRQGGKYVDNDLMAQCVVRTWREASDVAAAPPSSNSNGSVVLSATNSGDTVAAPTAPAAGTGTWATAITAASAALAGAASPTTLILAQPAGASGLGVPTGGDAPHVSATSAPVAPDTGVFPTASATENGTGFVTGSGPASPSTFVKVSWAVRVQMAPNGLLLLVMGLVAAALV